jgi:hypothetical protein
MPDAYDDQGRMVYVLRFGELDPILYRQEEAEKIAHIVYDMVFLHVSSCWFDYLNMCLIFFGLG